MKLRFAVLFLSLSLLTACSPSAPESEIGSPDTGRPADVALALDPAPAYLACRIIDGAEDGNLLLAELDTPLDHEQGLHDGKGVYRLTVGDIPVTLDGQPAAAGDLRDGMAVEITFGGTILESFPGQLGEVSSLAAFSPAGGALTDLCGLYLQVLDDLWEKDSALNENISLAALDLSGAPGGLLDSEKSALAWRFGEKHGVEVLETSYGDLLEQGYLTAVSYPSSEKYPTAYQWEDGCLFSIEANTAHQDEIYSLPVLFFNAEKWRTPLAAYIFYDCSALWPEFGSWSSYTVGSEMIS